MDAGILPLRALSARFRTVRRESFPTSAGISPESLFPMRSRMRREGSAVTQVGISPAMSFQSATTRVVRVSMPQIASETGATGFLEDGVFGLPAEVDVGDAAGGGVAADAVPVEAAVGARPRVEEAKVGLAQRLPEGQQRRPIRWRATAHGGAHNGENGRR
ncbi:hypothetical protein GmHk_08G022274 [Glycine max]|nr:hypothetical protein GmHk_08G022274 [Glycine max]